RSVRRDASSRSTVTTVAEINANPSAALHAACAFAATTSTGDAGSRNATARRAGTGAAMRPKPADTPPTTPLPIAHHAAPDNPDATPARRTTCQSMSASAIVSPVNAPDVAGKRRRDDEAVSADTAVKTTRRLARPPGPR